jgi:hypothetical protein
MDAKGRAAFTKARETRTLPELLALLRVQADDAKFHAGLPLNATLHESNLQSADNLRKRGGRRRSQADPLAGKRYTPGRVDLTATPPPRGAP